MKKHYIKSFVLYGALALLPVAAIACGGDDPATPTTEPNNPTVAPTDDVLAAKVGEVLPAWTEGTLDVHSISTGRGESYLYIFPDGTTLIVDAAGALLTPELCAQQGIAGPLDFKPNGNISSAKVIADYVEHFNPNGKVVDYWMNSHFDTDHMGNFPETYAATSSLSASIQKHPEGGFYLNGINELGTLLDFKKIIDRGYTTPVNRSTEKRFKDYIKFLDWTKKTKGTVYEEANVGHADQVVMTHNPSKYNDFSIRILCGGGKYWTGTGENWKANYPTKADGSPDVATIKADDPKENVYSVGFMLSFGKFDLFTAGDLQYNGRTATPWFDSEKPLIPVVKQVEVMKACHHGTSNTNSPELLKVLAPSTLLISPWRTVQPNPETLARFKAVNQNVNMFTTGVETQNKALLNDISSSMKSWGGHIVVRVAPNGEYKVYVLDDNNQQYKVKSIHGKYFSK